MAIDLFSSSSELTDDIQFPAWVAVAGEQNGLRIPGQSLPRLQAENDVCRVVFDGVLYNRSELRRELGVDATATSTDAELVLHAYRAWGEKMTSHLKGIFACLVWDVQEKTLLAVRDRLGVYPLFYAEVGRELLFSTSIDLLLKQPGVSGELNRVALAEQLNFHWPVPEETYFTAIRRVPPGHVMRAADGTRRLARYWHPVPPGEPIRWVTEDELERFDEVLSQAVERCMSLGPAGIFLSGGLDSVSVAAVAADSAREQELPPPWALSLIYPVPVGNEEVVQRGVAAHLGLPQIIRPIEETVAPKGVLLAAAELSSSWPVPLKNIWLPGYYALAVEGRRRGCRVLMTGGGGDEWLTVSPIVAADMLRSFDFAGIYRLWQQNCRSYDLSRRTALSMVLWLYGARPLLGRMARNVLLRYAPTLYTQQRRWRDARSIPQWIAPDPALRRELVDRLATGIPEPAHGSLYLGQMNPAIESPVNGLTMEENFETGRRLGVHFLHPYWDADLIALLCRTPPELLERHSGNKGLVRQTLARRFPQLGFERQRKVQYTPVYVNILNKDAAAVWAGLGGAAVLAELGLVNSAALEHEVSRWMQSNNEFETARMGIMVNIVSWIRSRLAISRAVR